jgi:hypothetical protein
VTDIQTQTLYDFLPGDPPQMMRVAVTGGGGGVTVEELRGSVRVSVAVVVHQMVDRFDALGSEQRHAAISLRLAPGDTLHFPVPAGLAWIEWMPRDGGTAHPQITAEGSGYCHVNSPVFRRWLPAGECAAYCDFAEGAGVRVARNGSDNPILAGALLIDRLPR